MTLVLPPHLLQAIHAHGEAAYPEEGAGLLLGLVDGATKRVSQLLPLANSREDAARHNRYLLTAEDYMHGEEYAIKHGLDVLGVFHSHPDHPNRPSEFDREWAMPWFSYLITSVHNAKAVESRSWLLRADRSAFDAEMIETTE
jgi:proteasome lid subunit RPN8/RPN11